MAENVVLLTVDALRPDHMSCYGYDRETTPNIGRFAEDAVTFETAYSASSHTREAVPAMLTGRYPEEAVAGDFTLAAPTLATHLSETHETAAFHSNPYLSRAYGFDTDFDRFYDDLHLGQNRYLAWLQRAADKYVFNRGRYHARAERINELALDWLASLDDQRPFFLWNHYMDVHGPYNPPAGFREFSESAMTDAEAQELYERATDGGTTLSERERTRLEAHYDDEITYLDAHVGELVSELEAAGVLAETHVIITSDHGEGFGENGYFGHPRTVDEALLRVPLLYRAPGATGRRSAEPVSTVDVVPTVLSALGRDTDHLPGVDLLHSSSGSDRVVYSSAAGEGPNAGTRISGLRSGDWSLVTRWDSESGAVLSETVHSTAADRRQAQTAVRADVDPPREELERLRTRMTTYRERFAGAPATEDADSGHEFEADAELEQRLEQLGYK